MEPTLSRSRKTLHLDRRPAQKSATGTSAKQNTKMSEEEVTNAPSLSRTSFDRAGITSRVIEIRHRCGNSITVSTAVDMRKKFFSSASIHEFN